MPFFEVMDDDPDEHGIPESPPWIQPPRLSFSGLLPMNQLLAEGERGAVALTLIRSFDVGCLFEVIAAIARPATRGERMELFSGAFRPLVAGKELPAGLLRFGVEYPDRRKMTTLARHPYRFEDGPAPEPPVLVRTAGRGNEAGSR